MLECVKAILPSWVPFLTVSYLLLYSVNDTMVTEWIKVPHFACMLIKAQKIINV